MVVAPASANTLAKMAQGICDNALCAVFLSANCPVMVAPAMDADMYANSATQENLRILSQRGVEVLPVGAGFLASAVFALLQFINLARFGGEYSWGSFAGILYLLLLLTLGVSGIHGWLRSRPR